MKSTADVVVIGAGVQGLSAAYHLGALGVGDVVVVEQAFIGAGSSGRSASMLMLQVWTEWQVRFSQVCFERYMRFQEELGVSPEYRQIGTLSLATQQSAPQELALAEMRRRLGVPCEFWQPDDLRRRFPALRTDDLAFGVFGAEDGVIEAQSIMMGYQAGARRFGVEIVQGARATGIRRDGEHIAAVETTEGEIQTHWVVNAAGADAARVGRWVGVDIPIDNRVRNVFVTDAFPAVPDEECPFVWDAAAEWYFRKERPGILIGIGKRALPEAAQGVDWAYLDEVFDKVVHRLPAAAEVGIAHGWSGIRSLSPDHRPILGPVAGVPGFINSCGWGGEGIMHAPIGGQLVAETIAYGAARTFPPEPFLLERFAGR
ncbi:MAG: FAD-binding oxidoreductase [Anaerolineae bacterium]|nr:FAD-binding oxidoreductase [Anaerolineae bacterium]